MCSAKRVLTSKPFSMRSSRHCEFWPSAAEWTGLNPLFWIAVWDVTGMRYFRALKNSE